MNLYMVFYPIEHELHSVHTNEDSARSSVAAHGLSSSIEVWTLEGTEYRDTQQDIRVYSDDDE